MLGLLDRATKLTSSQGKNGNTFRIHHYANDRFAPEAVIRALAKVYHRIRGAIAKHAPTIQPLHETLSRHRRAFCARGSTTCASQLPK